MLPKCLFLQPIMTQEKFIKALGEQVRNIRNEKKMSLYDEEIELISDDELDNQSLPETMKIHEKWWRVCLLLMADHANYTISASWTVDTMLGVR